MLWISFLKFHPFGTIEKGSEGNDVSFQPFTVHLLYLVCYGKAQALHGLSAYGGICDRELYSYSLPGSY